MNTCRICSHPIKTVFQANILHKYDISYFKCENCGFIQTEEPFWLAEAYTTSINITDTGLIQRNVYCAKLTSSIIKAFFRVNATYVDMAGGYGLFVRIMRDKGFNFLWNDLYTENIFARGFDFHSTQNKTIELITAFEAFEHFQNPLQELESMYVISRNIFFSTLLIPTDIPDKNWWYYAFEHGQHISFYSKQTLNYLAEKFNMYLYSNNKDFHLLTEKKLPHALCNLLFNYFKVVQYTCFNSKHVLSDSKFLKQVKI
ncbi:MAG: class I SAM-dependent methyltransferase [Bacteroidales bacterium]|jgi:hypothetical protein|nr:class I SAM-dependent methyltransferase [Bacteroidales bacterium]MDD3690461.1 class I SAM-dependent methyltransferase [Bacteroidales bacterium]MDD3939945.1 class I SAM-dependent methyltransferase [Patescibacteria group bacterium]MDD4581174.1 class I SAM-dependent methyltransferase [Bacteroidales bacterium]MDX9889335.1 class I SAM-dependent methyltransferase [Bacteroidales bacterium]